MLEPNQVFKNYKALCAYLGQPIKTGNAKMKQLAHWRQYFTYTTDKHKYIILTVMNSELDKIPEATGHLDAIWTRHISLQLYHALAEAVKNPESYNNRYGLNKLVLSTQDAFEAVGLVNEEFKMLSWEDNPEELPTSSIIFYRAASDKLYQILYKVIHTMHVKKVINVLDTYLVHTKKGGSTLRLATLDEWGKIRAVMGELLMTQYAHKNGSPGTTYTVNLRGLNKSFYKDLKDILESDEIYYSSKVYNISFLPSNLMAFSRYLLHEQEVDLSKGIINQASYDIIKKLIERDIKLPKSEDTRTYADLANMMIEDKSVYFELLEQTIPLAKSNY